VKRLNLPVLSIAALMTIWLALGQGSAAELVLTSIDHPGIGGSAMDQPELYAVMTANGVIIADGGGAYVDGGDVPPAIIEAFIDTGSSGFVISNLTATGAGDTSSLGLVADDFEADLYAEYGIGGIEYGWVTKYDAEHDFGIMVYNATPGVASELDLAAVAGQYDHGGFWVRQQPGIGEVISTPLGEIVDPVNIVGMPIISQRVMVMDPTPLAEDSRMVTYLLDLAASDPPIAMPETNITFEMYLNDFANLDPDSPMASSANPVIGGVGLSNQGLASPDNHLLFDTGSGSTFVTFAKARQMELLPGLGPEMTFEEYMADYDGPATAVGGIGDNFVKVPIITLDEIRIPAKEGFDVVWKDVDVLVADLDIDLADDRKLDGVFGMNLLLPAVTVDMAALGLDMDDLLGMLGLPALSAGPAAQAGGVAMDMADIWDLLGLLSDPSPGYFDAIVFDATNPDSVTLRLHTELTVGAIVGDLDGDGDVDIFDWTTLQTNFGASSPRMADGDLNNDGKVNIFDFAILQTSFGLTDVGLADGDLTGDGTVDVFDFAVFQTNYGRVSITPAQGDLDGDGDVDLFDWMLFQPNFGTSSAQGAVPEPATLALLALSALVLKRRRV